MKSNHPTKQSKLRSNQNNYQNDHSSTQSLIRRTGRFVYALACSLIILFSLAAQAQTLPLGSWQSHFPVNRMVSVTQNANEVFYAGEQMILILDKAERSISRLDKVSGLTQVGIRIIKHHPERDLLLVAYSDGNLDIVEGNTITNIADIQRYTLITDKSIHHIHFYDSLAYLSCSFGLVELDLNKYEVKNTYQTDNFAVNASNVRNDTIYMSTDEGIFQGNPNINLSDFTNWIPHEATQNLPFAYYSNAMEYFDNRLFADVNDTLMFYNGNAWQHYENIDAARDDTTIRPKFYNENNTIQYLEAMPNGERLVMTTNSGITPIFPGGYYFLFGTSEFINAPQQAVGEGETIYIANINSGAVILDAFSFSKLGANAPFSTNMYRINIVNNEVWATGGGVNASWQSLFRSDGVSRLKDGIWEVYNPLTRADLAGIFDMMPVVVHPTNGKTYIGSYRSGLVELDGESLTLYDNSNSTLASPPLDPSTVRVTGLAFDNENNLWISNYEATDPISVLRNDGSWEKYFLPSASAQIADMAIDPLGNKWIVVARGSEGVAVFNENVENPNYRILTTNNSELPNNDVNCLAVDRSGNVWVGTQEGTVVFECGGQMFTDGCLGRRVIVEEDDFGDYLLRTENVTAIAVDGADRKWFGTNNGIFVQSPNGEETVLRFTESNSPLPNDEIIDIAINDATGEVFIATTDGLVAYRSDATGGSDIHAEHVYAFPNPVRPSYDGPIAIKGLVENANVKITDISGTMIFETTALGGQAIWDGRDYNGRRAASGVYLVFSSNSDGLETLATKLVIIN